MLKSLLKYKYFFTLNPNKPIKLCIYFLEQKIEE
jgi:hypothetical protein